MQSTIFRTTLGRFSMLIATFAVLSPVAVQAEPLPMPADTLWSLSLNGDSIIPGPVWESGGSAAVLMGQGDRIAIIRGGEVVRSSESLGGLITAIQRADVVGGVEPEILVGLKRDSLNTVEILDGSDFSNLRTIELGHDWSVEGNPDSLTESQNWNEKTVALQWVGGERGMLLVGKELSLGATYGTAYGADYFGAIYRYSIPDNTLIDSIWCGYRQLWTKLEELYIIGSSHASGSGCGWFGGDSFSMIQYFKADFSVGGGRDLKKGYFEWPTMTMTETTASTAFRQANDSVIFIASTQWFNLYEGPSTVALCISSGTTLDSLTEIDLDDRPITSFVRIENPEGDGSAAYIMCIDSAGVARFLNPERLAFIAEEYVSPFGSQLVGSGDFNGDGSIEYIGMKGNRLTCVELHPLAAPRSEPSQLSTINFQLFPNPFNSSTTISYTLPRAGWTTMDVMDLNGRLVTRLSNGWKEAGSYREVWEGGQQASGLYFIKLQADDTILSRAIILSK